MAASRAVAITYVPADCGSIIPGKSKAPQAFRDVDIVGKIVAAGLPPATEHYALDTPALYSAATRGPNGVRNEDLNVAVCREVKRTISENLARPSNPSNPSAPPRFQLILGGECSMLPAVLAAFWDHATRTTTSKLTSTPTSTSIPASSAFEGVGLVYIDADLDLSSPLDPASTGIFAGMTSTHLLQLPGALPSMTPYSTHSLGLPVCSASNTIFFGTNISNPGNAPRAHLEFMIDGGLQIFSAASVAADPRKCARRARAEMEEQVVAFVVHLDVDSIDALEFPLANVPNVTGVGFEQMMAALGVLVRSQACVGLVVAEVNPDHDPGLGMIERLVGKVVEMLAERVEAES